MMVLPAVGVLILAALVPIALAVGLWFGLLSTYGFGIFANRGFGDKFHWAPKRASMYGVGLLMWGVGTCLAFLVLMFTVFGEPPNLMLLGIWPLETAFSPELWSLLVLVICATFVGGEVTVFVVPNTKGSLRPFWLGVAVGCITVLIVALMTTILVFLGFWAAFEMGYTYIGAPFALGYAFLTGIVVAIPVGIIGGVIKRIREGRRLATLEAV